MEDHHRTHGIESLMTDPAAQAVQAPGFAPSQIIGSWPAISLWQPWASLWLTERKKHETRHWGTKRRGWLIVHAAKRFERDFPSGDPLRKILEDEFGGYWAMELPTGALLGAVRLVDCVSTDRGPAVDDEDLACGNFEPGRFAWCRSEYRLLPAPIPYKGHQGFFTVPASVLTVSLPAEVPLAGSRRHPQAQGKLL